MGVSRIQRIVFSPRLTFPPNVDASLKDVVTKLLDKNPSTRITIDQLRNHPWVTNQNNNPLPSREQNCAELVAEITETDINAAVKPVQSLFTILKAASKLKAGAAKNKW